MAQSITLSAPIRSNLLTLQNTSSLINRTEGRLSTGLKVASPIDDAVAYFQSKALSDRSTDFAERKDGIDQGISSLTTAVNAITSTEAIVKQMKGLLLSAKSATDTERGDLMTQFNELSRQVNHLVNDSNYQGLNLVNSTATTLRVDFSSEANSNLVVNGNNLQISGLFMVAVSTGPLGTMTAAKVGQLASAILAGGWTPGTPAAGTVLAIPSAYAAGDTWSNVGTSVSLFDAAIRSVDTALGNLRSAAKSLGSNVALLQTRLDFTKSYVNTLTEGSGKLVLADMNEEGANLVALQTRQQLGMQALQFSGQAEQAVLQLLR